MNIVIAAGVLLVAAQADSQVPYDVTRYAANTCFLRIGEGGGSGVILGQRGQKLYILTSAHQILSEESILVSWFKPFGLQEMESKKPVGPPVSGMIFGEKDLVADLALITVESKELFLDKVKMAKKEAYVRPRSLVYSVGCEQGFPTIEVTQLIGRKLFSTIPNEFAFHWETVDITKPGRSGGPLFSAKGELLGVCHGYKENRGFYTHHLEILAFLKRNNIESVVSHD